MCIITTTTLGVTLSQRRPQLSKEDVKMATTSNQFIAPEGPSPNPQTATGKISLFITDSGRDLMLAQAIPPPSATSTLAVSGYKEFKMNKNQYYCRYSSSNASPASSDIPPDPESWRLCTRISHRTLGRVGRWQSYSGEFAFEHPDSIASTRYTWYTTEESFVKPKFSLSDELPVRIPPNSRIDVEDNSTVPKRKKPSKRKAQEAGIDSNKGEEDLSRAKKGVEKPLVLLKRKTDEEQWQSRHKAKGAIRSDEEDEEEQQASRHKIKRNWQNHKNSADNEDDEESVQSGVQDDSSTTQQAARMILFLRRRWFVNHAKELLTYTLTSRQP
ncbi:hypothetical protein BT96DRAFT_948365 [Gymnopus androsaceus JB14]|uniref:Uncharacterized protein n=1 Tax=Gymnopus androsaceus JB14 TaxID=1447944 RepID=A0A6A4GQA4_9AGAR|nr:hypothetical protein BT96DRAFT_948365 [Gymnopus androsaceus JB14]